MGLPMWTHSPEPKDALKVDLAAAAARSPIRRRSQGTRARSIRSPRSPDRDASRLSHLEAATRRSRLPPPPAPESPARDYTRFSSFRASAGGPPDEEHLIRLRRERYYRNLYDSGLPSFGEVMRYPSSRSFPTYTPNFAPALRNPRPERVSHHSRERASFTPDPYHRPGGRSRSPWTDAAPSNRSDNVVIIEDGDFEEGESAPVNLPPLRRMGRRTIADGPLPSSSLRESWSPTTTIDGLGDRDRSVSPAEDPWDTMLSTVAPDPLPPTADSSFTSAAASASFSNSHPSSRAGSSNSNSAASSRTHLTVPSRRHSGTREGAEQFFRACESSEDDTASDTEEEDMVDLFELTRGSTLTHHMRDRPAHRMEHPPPRNLHRQSHGLMERTREANAFVRNVLSERASRDSAPPAERPNAFQLDGPTEGDSFNDSLLGLLEQDMREAQANLREQDVFIRDILSNRASRESARSTERTRIPPVDGPAEQSGQSADLDSVDLDQELREARAILEQLRRRGDVPDNFWASVGLMRSIS